MKALSVVGVSQWGLLTGCLCEGRPDECVSAALLGLAGERRSMIGLLWGPLRGRDPSYMSHRRLWAHLPLPTRMSTLHMDDVHMHGSIFVTVMSRCHEAIRRNIQMSVSTFNKVFARHSALGLLRQLRHTEQHCWKGWSETRGWWWREHGGTDWKQEASWTQSRRSVTQSSPHLLQTKRLRPPSVSSVCFRIICCPWL